MTWTKCDYDDPSTLPPEGMRVDFAGEGWQGRGKWDPEQSRWINIETDGQNDYLEHRPHEVTHWQPMPELPGAEPKPDPRTRLGRWLAAVQCRTHRQFPPEGRHSTWLVRLVEDAGEEDESGIGEGEGPTLEAALVEALAKAGA
jgi:hypothetical protein